MSLVGSDDASLVQVPDLPTQLRREWPRIALRAAACILIPLFTARLIDASGLLPQLSNVVPVISFLRPGTEGYPLRAVSFLVLVLVLASFLLRQRAGQALLAISSAVVLAVGFNHSTLHWTKLFNFGEYAADGPGAGSWGYAIALLATVVLLILGEAMLDARRHQTARDIPEREAYEAARVARLGVAASIVGGAALVGGLLGLGALLTPSVASQTMFPRLNPVLVMLVLGVLMAGAVFASARKPRVAEERAPAPARAIARRLPPPGRADETVRVPVQEGPRPPPPPGA